MSRRAAALCVVFLALAWPAASAAEVLRPTPAAVVHDLDGTVWTMAGGRIVAFGAQSFGPGGAGERNITVVDLATGHATVSAHRIPGGNLQGGVAVAVGGKAVLAGLGETFFTGDAGGERDAQRVFLYDPVADTLEERRSDDRLWLLGTVAVSTGPVAYYFRAVADVGTAGQSIERIVRYDPVQHRYDLLSTSLPGGFVVHQAFWSSPEIILVGSGHEGDESTGHFLDVLAFDPAHGTFRAVGGRDFVAFEPGAPLAPHAGQLVVLGGRSSAYGSIDREHPDFFAVDLATGALRSLHQGMPYGGTAKLLAVGDRLLAFAQTGGCPAYEGRSWWLALGETEDLGQPPVAVVNVTVSRNPSNGWLVTAGTCSAQDPDGVVVKARLVPSPQQLLTQTAQPQLPTDAFLATWEYWPGTHAVAATVWDDQGLSATAQANVTIEGAPPGVNFHGTRDGLRLELDASWSDDPDGDIQRYQWVWGDGASQVVEDATNHPLASHTYTELGTYHVVLRGTDTEGKQGEFALDVPMDGQAAEVRSPDPPGNFSSPTGPATPGTDPGVSRTDPPTRGSPGLPSATLAFGLAGLGLLLRSRP